MGLLLPGNWDEEYWGAAECLHKGKTSLSLPGAQALHASGLGPLMVFVHFLMALLEPNTRPFSKRALA